MLSLPCVSAPASFNVALISPPVSVVLSADFTQYPEPLSHIRPVAVSYENTQSQAVFAR
jgi:hypothetical protein